MTTPTPSAIRVVRIYTLDQMLTSRGITPLDGGLKWPDKHPLDIEYWWVNATGWCDDIGDVIGDVDPPTIDGDGQLLCIDTVISADRKQVGFLLIGGTSGASYTITPVLNGSKGQDRKAVEIALSMQTAPEVQLPWFANFASAVNSGNYYYMVGASNARTAASADFSKPFNSQNYYYL